MARHRPVRLLRPARLIPAVALVVLVVWPLATLATGHLRVGAVGEVLGDPALRGVILATARLALVSTAAATVVGLFAAWALERHVFPGSRWLSAAVSVPFVMPAVVVATGVLAVVPDRGAGAVLWAHVVFNAAVVLHVVGPRWRLVPPAELEAAASLGAGPLARARHVVWPHLRESVLSATALVFVFCMTTYSVPTVLGDAAMRTIETEVFVQAVRLGRTDIAVALSAVQFVVVAVALVLARRGRTAPLVGAAGRVLTGGRPVVRWAAPLVGSAMAVFVASPLVLVVVRSLRLDGRWTLSGWRALGDGSLLGVGVDVPAVVMRSVTFALVTGTLVLVLALLTVRRARPGLLETMSLAVAGTSAVALGLGIVLAFDVDPVNWRSSGWLVPAVHTVIALPLAVRVVGPAVRAVDDVLLDTAADLGAGPARAWLLVAAPPLRPALARAWGLGAAVSLGEFGATSFLARSDSMTIPVAVASLMGRAGPLLQQAGFALSAGVVAVLVVGFAMASRSAPR